MRQIIGETEEENKLLYTVCIFFHDRSPFSLICCEILDKLTSLGLRQLLKMKQCEKVKRGNGTAFNRSHLKHH